MQTAFILLIAGFFLACEPVDGPDSLLRNSGDTSSSYGEFVVGAPIALSSTHPAFAEETATTISLDYTDAEGDLATACTITSYSNVSITQPCTCTLSGVCSVEVTGDLNFSGSTSLGFTITANGQTSAPASVSMTITNVDDDPVANNISPPAFDENTQSIITLSYTDPDGDSATACTVGGLTNITVTQACACSLGSCTVGVTGTSNYSGTASFTYTVTANARTSASATASLTISNVDDPITIFTYLDWEYYGATGVTPLSIVPTVDGTNHTFSVTPALPSGLTLNTATGAITGTATVNVDEQVYSIRASNGAGFKDTSVKLTYLEGITIDTFNAGIDDDGGIGACYSTAAAGCSLQAAVETANNLAGKNILLLNNGTYLTNDIISFDESVVLVGNGMDATIINPTVLNPGHGFGAITANISVMIKKVSISSYGMIHGAVMWLQTGTLTVGRSKFMNNIGSDGAVFLAESSSSVNATDSHFENNEGSWNGGVVISEGTSTFDRCYFTNNRSPTGSVALTATGSITISNSTIYNNTSSADGTLTSQGGSIHLTNVTMAYNTNSSNGPAGIHFMMGSPTFNVSNSIIAYNTQLDGTENNCFQTDVLGTLNSLGSNMVSDAGGNCEFSGVSDFLNTLPELATLTPQNNGGLTPTFNLAPASPALDAGVSANCTGLDQRRLTRIVGASCDIGAFEVQ